MNALEKFFTQQAADSVSGNWYLARWMPDAATGEQLNIGVCFVGQSGESDFRVLDSFERVTCLYSSPNASFHAHLACEVAEAIFSEPEKALEVHYPNLHIEKQGFAQGDTAAAIVDRLFSSVIPLAVPKAAKSTPRFNSISRKKAASDIKKYLKHALSIQSDLYIPPSPDHEINDEFGKTVVYLPFIRPSKNGKGAAASIASAMYSDMWRAKSSLYEGLKDVEIALNAEIISEGALAVMMPSKALSKNQQEALDEYASFENYAKRSGIPLLSGSTIEGTGDRIKSWMLAS